MSTAVLDLVLLASFLIIKLGLRVWRHWRTTRSTGFRGISGRGGSPGWFGGAHGALGLRLAVAAPDAHLTGLVQPILTVRTPVLDAIAVLIAVLGILGTWWAQSSLGRSWRIGVRGDERTDLVSGGGPFEWVRNPIFTFTILSI